MTPRDYWRVAACLLASMFFLLGFSGCEDPQSHAEAQKALADVAALKEEVSQLKAQNAKLLEQLRDIPAKLAAQIDERIDKTSSQLSTKNENVLKELKEITEQTRANCLKIVGDLRGDFEKLLENTKALLAGDLQKLREDNQKTFNELKKYMENQLRDLYPYAYQPHRESKAPPEPDVKAE